MFRIGYGYDVHALCEGRDLIIGGVKIPYERGLLGHSDADVLLHAVCDSILGAAALGDIGCLFPDNDERFSGIDSRILLRKTVEVLHENGYKIVNIDSVIAAQSPKMRPYIDRMRANIAEDCGIDVSFVSVKATTEEGMGFTGRKEGIKATAVTLIDFI